MRSMTFFSFTWDNFPVLGCDILSPLNKLHPKAQVVAFDDGANSQLDADISSEINLHVPEFELMVITKASTLRGLARSFLLSASAAMFAFIRSTEVLLARESHNSRDSILLKGGWQVDQSGEKDRWWLARGEVRGWCRLWLREISGLRRLLQPCGGGVESKNGMEVVSCGCEMANEDDEDVVPPPFDGEQVDGGDEVVGVVVM
ncbi:hypothetical protein Tco_1503797 [Tanacetum coccineum]